MIGLGTSLDEREFVRRVRIAFRAIDISDEKSTFIANTLRTIDRGVGLSEAQMTALYRATVRYKRQITDSLVVELAEQRTKEAS